jgi:aminoglycoside phosphotransferase (APT) family kinase protein
MRHLLAVAPQLSAQGPLVVELISGGRSNLTYRVSDGNNRWVLRRPPLGLVLHTAHDMVREARVMTALAASPVPVPRVVAICGDSSVIGVPFYLMDEVKGVVYRDRELVEALAIADRLSISRSLVDTLAALHRVDPVAVGLGDLAPPSGYLERQLRRWVSQYDAAEGRQRDRVVRLAESLRQSMPVSPTSRLVHGDYRLDNVMINATPPLKVAAVLDWEMCTLGDPLADLGLLISCWDLPGEASNPITGGLTALPGFQSRAQVLDRYAQRTDADLAQIDWYVAFALWKTAVILEQISTRHARGLTAGTDFDDIPEMALSQLDQAEDAVLRST